MKWRIFYGAIIIKQKDLEFLYPGYILLVEKTILEVIPSAGWNNETSPPNGWQEVAALRVAGKFKDILSFYDVNWDSVAREMVERLDEGTYLLQDAGFGQER